MNKWERALFKRIGMPQISRLIPQIPDVSPSPVKGALLGTMLPNLERMTEPQLEEFLAASELSETQKDELRPNPTLGRGEPKSIECFERPLH